jgi:RND superfamily putative drug exporter
VVIALLALAVSGVSLITVLGQAAAIVVVVAVLTSTTLLPALLALCGDRIEKLRSGRDKRPTLGHLVSRVHEEIDAGDRVGGGDHGGVSCRR